MADDRTAFLIDMAAKLTGGESSVASLGQLGEKMIKAGATAVELESAVKSSSIALEEAAQSMRATASAVGAGEETYRAAEIAADKAAKAVERLAVQADGYKKTQAAAESAAAAVDKIGIAVEAQRSKLERLSAAGNLEGAQKATERLGELVDRQEELRAKSLLAAGAAERASQKLAGLADEEAKTAAKASAASAALKLEGAALDGLKSKAASAVADHDKLTKGLKSLKIAADETAKAESKVKGSGKVNEIAEAFGKLGGPMGVAGQQAFGLATGFVKLGGSIGKLGPYVAAAAVFLAVATGALTATGAIAKWSVGLADANRTTQLLTAGVAGTVAGGVELDATINRLGATVPQTRDELLAMAGDLKKSGLEGAALSSALEEAAIKAATLKFGPDFAKQMLSLDVQSKRLSANLASTFGGLKIEGLLAGFSKLVALFDSSTESGSALKFLFEKLFQPIIDKSATAMTGVERLFIQAEILALKAYIALKPYSSQIETLAMTFAVGAAVIGGVLVVAVFALIAAVGIAVGLFGAFVAVLVEFIDYVVNSASAILDGFGAAITLMSDLGGQLIDGLVKGITGGATAVIKAMSGVVGGAIDSAKSLLGIASPSKVFAVIGDHTAQGFAEGVEGGTSDAQGALENMVAPPSGGGVGGGGTNVGGVQVTFIIQGAQGADEIVAKARDMLVDFFEGASLSIGGGEAAT